MASEEHPKDKTLKRGVSFRQDLSIVDPTQAEQTEPPKIPDESVSETPALPTTSKASDEAATLLKKENDSSKIHGDGSKSTSYYRFFTSKIPVRKKKDDVGEAMAMDKLKKDIENETDADDETPPSRLRLHLRIALRFAIGLFYGFLFGLYLHMWLLKGIPYVGDHRLMISVVCGTILGVVLALKCAHISGKKLRCILCVAFPEASTNRGRAVFISIIISLLISGPVTNIVTNTQEISNSYQCAMKMIKSTISDHQEQINGFQKMVEKLRSFLEEMMTKFADLREDLLKAKTQMEEFIDKAKPLVDAYQGVVCLGGLLQCDTVNFTNPIKFDKEKYKQKTLLEEAVVLKADGIEQGIKMVNDNDYVTLRQHIKRALVALVKNTEFFGLWLSKLFYLSVFLIIYHAHQYVLKYCTDDMFDNHLVDEKHKKMREKLKKKNEMERKTTWFGAENECEDCQENERGETQFEVEVQNDADGENGILKKSSRATTAADSSSADVSGNENDVEDARPIDEICSWEKKYFQSRKTPQCNRKERQNCRWSLLPSIVTLIVVCAICIADRTMYEGLSVAQRYGNASLYVAIPSTKSAILNNLTEEMADFQLGKVNISSQECLPKPKTPSYYTYIYIFVLLLICFSTSIFQTYIRRYRAKICDYFYPKRKYERQEWLYTEIERGRKARKGKTKLVARYQYGKLKRRQDYGFGSAKSGVSEETSAHIVELDRCLTCSKESSDMFSCNKIKALFGKNKKVFTGNAYTFTVENSDGQKMVKTFQICPDCNDFSEPLAGEEVSSNAAISKAHI